MVPTSNVPDPNRSTEFRKTAVGYVRVSTSTQAEDGLSPDAQRAAITAYCHAHELRLLRIYTDVESGAKRDRQGLEQALTARADVFVVLKFDRLIAPRSC
jgi:DNA invertase Pin-like site-specific DNA recombinase